VDAFKAHLPQLDWMDEESAVAAAEKVHPSSNFHLFVLLTYRIQADAIRVKVGYPLSPDTLSARSIYLYYLLVRVQEYTFFENVIGAACVSLRPSLIPC
jgi:endothelin-converting enzyme